MDQAHFISDYTAIIERLLAEHPDDRPLAMARAVGSVSMETYRSQGDQQVSVLKRCGLRDGMFVYDLACGSGRTAAALIRSGWKGQYKGADIMPALVDHLRATCPGYEAVVHTDLTISMPDASLDIIYAWSLFTHLLHEETYLYMEDAMRALKPGGVLVFSFLEFEMPEHWVAFENVITERRHRARTHMNAFLHRDQITLWARRLGFAGSPKFIDGNDASATPQGAFWQSLAVLRKAS
jgi:SAM-dependent methyltransferase